MTESMEVEALLAKFSRQRILVVGDLMLDRYVSGTVSRISPEAPVPVVLVDREEARPGGAANVASNICALGGQATMAGIVGEDEAARELTGILAERGIAPEGVVRDKRVRTTVKMRILAERQQVVRVDYENALAIDDALVESLCARLTEVVPQMDAVIVEDYGKGVACKPVVQAILKAAKGKQVLVGFDPKDNRDLGFTTLTLATPNYMEACLAAGLPFRPIGDEPLKNPVLKKAGEILMQQWNCALLIITLGSHGMYLVSRAEAPIHIPTVAREVFDVSGAGDTVIATAMLALASGADHRLAAMAANTAAGVVVAKVGTATCSAEELLANWHAVAARRGA
ncbi:MAG: PfkB family carbohydrate kinase [Verrucomicrobia bacterium]|nr:PfkB family carbohydrate kinase [Verrucomicrobiota bacterium]